MGAVGLFIIVVIAMAFAVFEIAAWWKVFEKAGRPGWTALIPIYNVFVLLRIVGRPWWLLLFILIPVVDIPFSIGLALVVFGIDLSKSFGKGGAFGLGLFVLTGIFIPILGFGNAQYQGPAARKVNAAGGFVPTAY